MIPIILAITMTRAENPMLRAAQAFIASLKTDQKVQAVLPFNSEERFDWFFIPKERKGLPFKQMDSAQQAAAIALLKTGLSQKGFEKVATIRQLENVLKVLEQGRGPARDTELYYFTVFGEPSVKAPWGLRYEGHHVSLHWTMIDGKVIASTPTFLGSNPGEVLDGPMKGTRVLKAEEDLGRELVKSLNDSQRSEAIISDKAPNDILTGNQRIAAIQEDKGLAYNKLTREQQGILLSLIREYAGTMPNGIAKGRLDKLRKAGMDNVKFGWMGELERFKPHYYRVQGPTFLIEYDNTQNNANHIHSVWRDFKGDFGRDLLAEHYKSARGSDHGHDHDHEHDHNH